MLRPPPGNLPTLDLNRLSPVQEGFTSRPEPFWQILSSYAATNECDLNRMDYSDIQLDTTSDSLYLNRYTN